MGSLFRLFGFSFAISWAISLAALPAGGHLARGEAILVPAADSMKIHVKGGAVIEWDAFDLGANETLSFIQSMPKHSVLNRVKGGSLSQILGKIESNCPLYFILSDALIGEEGAIFSTQGDIVLMASFLEARGKVQAGNGGLIQLVAKKGGCIIDSPFIAESGRIEILAKTVHLTKNSCLDVSGDLPGTIEIGGSVETIQVDEGATLFANGKLEGDGGQVSLVAKQSLTFHGLAQVCGGSLKGNGGTIHLSSSGPIFDLSDSHPIVEATATHGKTGTVVFDPKYVTISPEGLDSATGNTFGSNPSDTIVISGSTLGMAIDAANVVIQANSDIVFQDIVATTTAGNGLTLQAGRSIYMNGQLTLNGADFNATINDSGAMVADRDSGVAVFQVSNSAMVLTQGGNIAVDVGNYGGSQVGEMSINDGTLDAGGGDISLTGFARQDGSSDAYGIFLSGSPLIQTSGSGTISLSGQGGNGSVNNLGIYISSSGSLIQADGGAIQLTGTGGGNGTGNGNIGIYTTGVINNTGSGPVTLNGTGGLGVHGNMGVCVSGGQINAVDGAVIFNGTGGGSGALNFGIRLESSAECIATGAGILTFSGTSGSGKNNNHGVILSGGSLAANTGSISVTGIGQGSLNYNYGIRFEGISQCVSNGTAPISLQGQCMSALNGGAGISIATQGVAISSVSGDILLDGTSNGTMVLNQGIRIEMGEVVSTGTGVGAANIHLIGVGAAGTNYCNGVDVEGFSSEVTSVDGNIVVEGTSFGTGIGNDPIFINPSSQVNTTGSGMVTYISH